jgi:protein-disulfide isomerase
MAEPQANEQRTTSGGRWSAREFLNPLAIVIAGAMISGAIVWSGRQPLQVIAPPAAESAPGAQPATPAGPQTPADIALVNVTGEPTIGSPSAPVVMAYWFDYQCPFCRQEEETVLPQVINDYVDTGKIRIVFKDYPFLGPDSQTAGLAARAVWQIAPDKFRDWHKAMFDHQDEENAGWGQKADILALTMTIPGIDASQVDALMTSQAATYNTAMSADAAEGNAMGVGGTPSILVGKEMFVGVQSYATLKAAIDAVLKTP